MNIRYENQEDGFVERAGKALQAEAEALDVATRSRLNRARQSALAELDKNSRSSGGRWNWMPAGGMALVSVLVAIVWLGGNQPVEPTTSAGLNGRALPNSAVYIAPAAGELEVLMVDEDFEMLQDLEFYNWLQSVPGHTSDVTLGEGSVG
jgi:hypothetical protein